MGTKKQLYGIFLIIMLGIIALEAKTQPNSTIELNKPERYQNKLLRAEKSELVKFNTPKRLYNNMVSQYNYFFNANVKLEEILTTAKENFKEDYTQLLPFYNYTLDQTASDNNIDTIIYKCTAGILLHDLRSDWVDQFYLMLGKAYMLRKDFDSAAMVFQYINYAFGPKDEGYDMLIGSNESNKNGIFSISTNERRSVWKKISSPKPTRNESLLWQVRNNIEENKLTEAESLLELIRSDKLFPARLKTDWYEMEAYLQYTKESYDSAAHFIIKALDNAENRSEKSRWEFLAAQLLAKRGKNNQAVAMYEKSILHAVDPIMEVYARLNIVGIAAENKPNALQENLTQLLQMAKRDRYEGYKNIIYAAAAEIEMKRNNYEAVEQLLLKSIKTTDNDESFKQQCFLKLADASFSAKKMIPAARYYDSIQIPLLKEVDQKRIEFRRPPVDTIAINLNTIILEDSLQKIAKMTFDDRNIFLKGLLKKLRKEKGLKDAESEVSYGGNNNNQVDNSSDLFKSNGNEFYFNSNSFKAKGINEFKTKWGNRPNIDNWRRQTAVERTFVNTITPEKEVGADKKNKSKPDNKEMSIATLMSNIPLTSEAKDVSNNKIIFALMSNGYIFQYYLEDYPSAIESYESILKRYPDSTRSEELLFNLNNCYNKIGAYKKADSLVKQMEQSYPTGKFTKKLTAVPIKKKVTPATQAYDEIYQTFLSGRFNEALEKKNIADSLYGKNFQNPQLMYVEAIYYIKQKQDSIAIHRLTNIVTLFSGTEMSTKAATMINVLKKRKEIEEYLTNLEVERQPEIEARKIDLNSTNIASIDRQKKESTVAPVSKELSANTTLKENTILKPTIVAIENNEYQFNESDTQYVSVILTKVDRMFVSEAKNAFNRFNQEKFYGEKIPLSIFQLTDDIQLILFGPFNNASEAINLIDQVKPATSARILPWLSADKYSFSMISSANLELLVKKKDIEKYRIFLHNLFPDKF